ncbi:FkbM family methyltransferase [Pantoea ananatis]|uniref:FkbM family methyltransferase n=1 Tax=Pantoea ananas TaxID=553 RepID=UPI001908D2BA|nr:FkbM family methyltransferase [Pantoea ananatis]
MPIVSFAQNFEDVMLWRALKNVNNGFYVDIGANDPTIDSVTKLFYQNGWMGINVEPLKKHYNALEEKRDRDINLNCAVSDCTDELEIWECDVRGWATLDKKVAEQHELNGFKGRWTKTPVKTLTQILDENLPKDITDIHFLKIDVEGVEEAVVKGNNWTKFRPWILVIESTIPNSQDESHDEWEEILLSHDYILSYFDGLNRFYVSKEHEDLIQKFKTPPNVFDEFITHSEENKKNIIDNLNKEIIDQKDKLDDLSKENFYMKTLIDEIYASKSWKLTSPLRWFSSVFKRN